MAQEIREPASWTYWPFLQVERQIDGGCCKQTGLMTPGSCDVWRSSLAQVGCGPRGNSVVMRPLSEQLDGVPFARYASVEDIVEAGWTPAADAVPGVFCDGEFVPSTTPAW